jgi:TRAP-type mannitol/chloroaromatic compound transport system substrate-binding protein
MSGRIGWLLTGGVAALVIIAAVLFRGEISAPTGEQEGAQETAEYRWKMQSLWQAGSINQTVFEDFCDRITEITGGRLVIEPLPVGSVVGYNETLDAVAAGVLDAQHGGTGYFAGKDPAFGNIGDINGGYEHVRQLTMWFEYGGGKELARELFSTYGLYYIGGVSWGHESIPAKKAIRKIADFSGVKIRAPEGMSQVIFKRIGAAPVNIPGAEVYTALDRGVVEAADWGTLGMNDDLGFHAIAPYPIYPGFHSAPMADVAVNMERWNELPNDIKALVEMAVRDFNRDMIERIGIQDAAVAAAAAEKGIELVAWSAEERRKFREVASGVWAEYAAQSPMAQRIYESHMAFLARLGLL